MHDTNKKKYERAEREVRRRDQKIETMRKENKALLDRALAAENALRAEARGFHAVTVRMAFAYGEDVMDEERGKSIGKRLTLPPMDPAEIVKYEVKGRTDENKNGIIAVGLRDDPDDHKTDAQLAAEAEEHQRETEGEKHE